MSSFLFFFHQNSTSLTDRSHSLYACNGKGPRWDPIVTLLLDYNIKDLGFFGFLFHFMPEIWPKGIITPKPKSSGRLFSQSNFTIAAKSWNQTQLPGNIGLHLASRLVQQGNGQVAFQEAGKEFGIASSIYIYTLRINRFDGAVKL